MVKINLADQTSYPNAYKIHDTVVNMIGKNTKIAQILKVWKVTVYLQVLAPLDQQKHVYLVV